MEVRLPGWGGQAGQDPKPCGDAQVGSRGQRAEARGTRRCEEATLGELGGASCPLSPSPWPSLTCLEVEGDAGLGEVRGVALGADAADGSAVDVLLGRCRH